MLVLCIRLTIGTINFNIDGNANFTCKRTLDIYTFKHAVIVHIQFSTYVINLVHQIRPNKDVTGSQLNEEDATVKPRTHGHCLDKPLKLCDQ